MRNYTQIILKILKSIMSPIKNQSNQSKGTTPYLVKILQIYYDQDLNEIMVKFKHIDTRIGGSVSVNEFMKSPLVYFVHPDQLFLLGCDYKEHQYRIADEVKKTNLGKIINRFKRVFYI